MSLLDGKHVDVAWIYARLIRALRLEIAVSQRRFSRMMGVSQSSLSHLEAGRQGPTLHQLLRAERLFTKALMADLGDPDDPSPIERPGWLTTLGFRVAARLVRQGAAVRYRSLEPSEEPVELVRIDDEVDEVIDGLL